MKTCLLALSIMAVLVAGCGDQNAQVVNRPPEPYVYEPPVPPVPPPVIHEPVPPPVIHEPGPPPLVESWEPPGGITRAWRYIVIHHTDSDIGSLSKIDQWHRDKGWDGCGYHFVIGNGTYSADGSIQPSLRWKEQGVGAHTRLSAAFARYRGLPPNYYNEYGIGIVMVGNFDKGPPDSRQMASLARLVRYLMDRCHIPESRVVTHGGVDQTHCPGRYFSRTQLLLAVRALRAETTVARVD
jgi:hypothetical protein